MNAEPRVTTVVATRDRWPDLQQSLPRHEGPVILVDNGSADGTPERVREAFPHVRVMEAGRNLGAVARNLGVAEAETPYVAFADDDSWWEPGSLRRAAAIMDEHPRLGLLAGRILVGPAERPDPTSVLMAESPLGREPDLPGPSVLGFLACGSIVRRAAYLGAGGFDSVVEFLGEEARLALDLAAQGWGLAYVDAVVAHHHPSPSRGTSRQRQARLVRNDLLTAVMRLPWPVVVDTVREAVVAGGAAGRRGAWQSVPRIPQALRRRRVVPASVESRRRLLLP